MKKYKVINPGTDIDGAIYTEEEICIAAGIKPTAFGAIALAMGSFWGCRFEHVSDNGAAGQWKRGEPDNQAFDSDCESSGILK